MSVAAYCYSRIKKPKFWSDMTIDEVVTLGDTFYNDSIATLHMHEPRIELKPQQLQKYLVISKI